MRWFGLNVLFVLGVCASWAWFHVAPTKPKDRYHFTIRTNTPGWQYEPVPLSNEVTKILATTNLLNGILHGPQGERIAVFLGEWKADRAQELSVVAHTPDICWTRAGWTPTPSPLGTSIELAFREATIPFEVRTFRPPDGGPEELTLWCTLVNGCPYTETGPLPPAVLNATDNQLQVDTSSRRLLRSHLLNALKSRFSATGEKQFIRFSTKIIKNSVAEIEILKAPMRDLVKIAQVDQ
jgi:hypothetical protein